MHPRGKIGNQFHDRYTIAELDTLRAVSSLHKIQKSRCPDDLVVRIPSNAPTPEKKTTVSCRLPVVLLKDVDEFAGSVGMSRSAFVSSIILYYNCNLISINPDKFKVGSGRQTVCICVPRILKDFMTEEAAVLGINRGVLLEQVIRQFLRRL